MKSAYFRNSARKAKIPAAQRRPIFSCAANTGTVLSKSELESAVLRERPCGMSAASLSCWQILKTVLLEERI
jgi:hypothetical protein